MPAPPGPVLIRAVQLLCEKGEMPEDVLIEYLWPVVPPGVAYRKRQYDCQRSRERARKAGLREIGKRELSQAEAVEIGARRIVVSSLRQWHLGKLISRDKRDGRTYIELLRMPGRRSDAYDQH